MPTAYILAGLIALCPVLCGVVDVAIESHSHAMAHGPTVPDECPEPSDNCICHGAVVQPSDGKVLSCDGGVLGTSLDLFRHSPSSHISHLTWDGSPGGLAALGDSLTVRSFLQNFRC
jgi:hypothetical protein